MLSSTVWLSEKSEVTYLHIEISIVDWGVFEMNAAAAGSNNKVLS